VECATYYTLSTWNGSNEVTCFNDAWSREAKCLQQIFINPVSAWLTFVEGGEGGMIVVVVSSLLESFQ
jgi:hypothetical protein